MRIAYVIIDCDGRDGTAIAMAHVMHRMARAGHEVHLFADDARGADLNLVRWHRVRALPGPAVARFSSFFVHCSLRLRLWRDGRFDVVHSAGCNTIGANVYQIQNIQPAKRAVLRANRAFANTGSAARRLAHRAYYAVTSAAERRVYRPVKSAAFGGSGSRVRFAPVSLGVSRELQTHYPVTPDDLDVIPNGVDLGRFRPSMNVAERDAIRRELGVAGGQLLLLFLGGEWKRKGLRHAIEAMPLLRTPQHTDGAVLIVAGVDAAREEYESLATRLGVIDRIRFAGFTAVPERLLAAADVFVFPTYYEAFSLATLEASAAGLPIVTAVTNGTEELIRPVGIPIDRPGENGVLVSRDARHIAAAINAIAADAELLKSMGRRAREVAEADYDWDVIADRFQALYVGIVAGAAQCND